MNIVNGFRIKLFLTRLKWEKGLQRVRAKVNHAGRVVRWILNPKRLHAWRISDDEVWAAPTWEGAIQTAIAETGVTREEMCVYDNPTKEPWSTIVQDEDGHQYTIGKLLVLASKASILSSYYG
jgi:hypothetical protein